VEKRIVVDTREEAERMLGIADGNLRLLKGATNTQIIFKDGIIRIRGEKNGVNRAYNALLRLKDTAKTNSSFEMGNHSGATKFRSSKTANIFRDGVVVSPRSEGQKRYLGEIERNSIIFSIGPAGTGKTFLAIYKALEELKKGDISKICLVRPVVEAGEKLGFLPGDIQAKVNPYLRPMYDALNHFLEFGQLKGLIENDIIEIVPLAYMRGRTLDSSFIILDEAQNTTHSQMKMFLTRMGTKSKIIVTGDITQIDLPKGVVSGLVEAQNLLKGIEGISFVYLTKADIVRQPLVQKIVESYE